MGEEGKGARPEKKRKKGWHVEFELEKKRTKRQCVLVRKGKGTWHVWVGIKKLIFSFNI